METTGRKQQIKRLGDELQDMIAFDGLSRFSMPSNIVDVERTLLQAHLADATAKSNEFTQQYYAERLAKLEAGEQPPVLDPDEVFVRPAQASVEAAIARSGEFGALPAVVAGEWPTGTLNAESIRRDDGYLVLLHAGSNVLFHHFVAALVHNKGDGLLDGSTIAHLLHVLTLYVQNEDILQIPATVAGDFSLSKINFYVGAMRVFVLAHEYGHILRGHFDDVPTVGPLKSEEDARAHFIVKNWEQEFEADSTAWKLTLGDELLTSAQRATIEAAFVDGADPNLAAVNEVAQMQAAIAAPLLFFTLVSLFDRGMQACYGIPDDEYYSTHPPANERRRRFVLWVQQHAPSSNMLGGWQMAVGVDKLTEELGRVWK